MLLSGMKMQDAGPEKIPWQEKNIYATESSPLLFPFLGCGHEK